MYTCSACGGDLKFDIESQKVKCSYCMAEYEPEQVKQDKDAEGDSFDITIHHCPQCGGEIYSVDDTLASFCSYCGASAVLESRLEKENKVQYIIPFKKTKEQCKKAYMKLAKRAIFAPKELKQKKYIDEFRGIYMPYWMYDVSNIGEIHFPGEKSHRSGDYIITDHYDLRMDVDMEYSGLHYDGAASFADDISMRLAPFEISEKREFKPSYLCGFYADMSDVSKDVYMSDVTQFALERSSNYIKRESGASAYSVETNKIRNSLPIRFDQTDSAMFPVWFLAYRNRDRVAYATVNGQTGKVVADLPIDIKKYLLGSAILSIPIIILLNMFFTVIPSNLVIITMLLALLVGIVHCVEMKKIMKKEGNLEDKGKQYLKEKEKEIKAAKIRKIEEERKKRLYENPNEEDALLDLGNDEVYEIRREDLQGKMAAPKNKVSFNRGTAINIGIIILVSIMYGISLVEKENFMMISDGANHIGHITSAFILFIVTFILGMNSCKNAKMIAAKKEKKGGVFPIVAALLGFLVEIYNPVDDMWYYCASIAALIAVAVCLIDIILGYNILTTRKMVQFNHRGGDDRA